MPGSVEGTVDAIMSIAIIGVICESTLTSVEQNQVISGSIMVSNCARCIIVKVK